MPNLYTRTGDKGMTGLVGGSRVSKADVRVDCYGIIDEANSMLGFARSLSKEDYVKKVLKVIQERLFALGAELASDEKGLLLLTNRIEERDILFLEEVADVCTEKNGRQTGFVVPGVNPVSGALHVARTIVRRAERAMIRVQEEANFSETLLKYINRLSDTVYALGRLEETLWEEETLRDRVAEEVRKRLEEGGREPVSEDLSLEEELASNRFDFNKKADYSFASSLGKDTRKREGTEERGEEEGNALCLSFARRLSGYAREKAEAMGIAVVFALVDGGGNLCLLERMDGSLQGSIDVAINKAYTANAFRMPTDALGREAGPGGSLYGIEQTNRGRVVLFGGGYPLTIAGRMVGGIGISGGTADQDMMIANYVLAKSKEA